MYVIDPCMCKYVCCMYACMYVCIYQCVCISVHGFKQGLMCVCKGLSDRSLHICILPVIELICKKSIRLRYIKLHIDTFVMIIRTLSEEANILNELGKENLGKI